MMCKERKVAVISLVIIVIVMLSIGNNISSIKYNDKGEVSSKFYVSIKIYRNGNLVYSEERDPVTNTFVDLVGEMIGRSRYIPHHPSTAGNWITSIEESYIAFINTYVAYKPDLGYDDINSYIVGRTNNFYANNFRLDFGSTGESTHILYISKSWASTVSDTIHGIAWIEKLRSYYCSYSCSNYYYNVVVMYEPISGGIQVDYGDVITVVYEIHFPMGSGGK